MMATILSKLLDLDVPRNLALSNSAPNRKGKLYSNIISIHQEILLLLYKEIKRAQLLQLHASLINS